ncbi:hypothetical protein [Enterovibrio baiacu]|uniref:hypothetical protein n=1 Tax=Enterovibrio baiacu TaxID=2491023 RepID=UPI001012ACB9|nr:hypothetical protein [Enterovibrio baiacu]MBE1275014.1 hypothetical protein [Enterovibrio baiacu]
MNWELTQDIMDDMPVWMLRNEQHALVRHLLTLPSPPTDENHCYEWVETESSLARQLTITSCDALKLVIEALYLTENTLADDITSLKLAGNGLQSARATLFHQALMSAHSQKEDSHVVM